jgi:hypothetical protein
MSLQVGDFRASQSYFTTDDQSVSKLFMAAINSRRQLSVDSAGGLII